MPTTEKLEKELFEMAYNWGKVGVVTDNECFAFKSTMQEIIQQALAEERERVREKAKKLKKDSTFYSVYRADYNEALDDLLSSLDSNPK